MTVEPRRIDPLVGRTFRLDVLHTEAPSTYLIRLSAVVNGKIVGQVEQESDHDRLDEVLRCLPNMLRECVSS